MPLHCLLSHHHQLAVDILYLETHQFIYIYFYHEYGAETHEFPEEDASEEEERCFNASGLCYNIRRPTAASNFIAQMLARKGLCALCVLVLRSSDFCEAENLIYCCKYCLDETMPTRATHSDLHDKTYLHPYMQTHAAPRRLT